MINLDKLHEKCDGTPWTILCTFKKPTWLKPPLKKEQYKTKHAIEISLLKHREYLTIAYLVDWLLIIMLVSFVGLAVQSW